MYWRTEWISRRRSLLRAALGSALLVACGFSVALALTSSPAGAQTEKAGHLVCASGYVSAVIGGESKCLRAGEFCSASAETDYEKYGFTCIAGRLQSGTSTTTAAVSTTVPTTAATAPITTTTAVTTIVPAGPATTAPTVPPTTAVTTTATSTNTNGSGSGLPSAVDVGTTILLAPRTNTRDCRLGPYPDRACSPGAIYSGLTQSVICSSTFHTGMVRDVPESEKHQIEREYGLAPKSYRSALEIDHITPLELGGSNDAANLYPERAAPAPGFRVKDRLENRVHSLVCSGQMTLRVAQVAIATDWQSLYERVYGVAP